MSRRHIDLQRVRESHRRWLGRSDLLDQSWFILASGPNPTVPADIGARARIVCINNAAATAAKLGLGAPGLTFRNSNKEWKSVAGCKLPLVLWMSNKGGLEVLWTRLFEARGIAGEIRAMHKSVREDVTRQFLGSELDSVGLLHKPSTGIFSVLYALFVGVPEIILGGVTVDKDGYSYGSLPGIQRHRDEDFVAMRLIAERYPMVRTTEAEVSDRTGIPLFR